MRKYYKKMQREENREKRKEKKHRVCLDILFLYVLEIKNFIRIIKYKKIMFFNTNIMFLTVLYSKKEKRRKTSFIHNFFYSEKHNQHKKKY